ncbi:hypothetical protein K505DRAFT_338629 [Melanomma pulvis-pyrius CBS 109.77]|uniref:Uncharacterized protein n=1 Tax=Melanomma pulvis-pyrius CBS 109.77 TaxID=1314802 RepID=A0A6A6X7W3_9PLEO|nr:hypothetical protein K505DRAFT_338629 [Melanomma pulvis-pyrius CBS 109.77]
MDQTGPNDDSPTDNLKLEKAIEVTISADMAQQLNCRDSASPLEFKVRPHMFNSRKVQRHSRTLVVVNEHGNRKILQKSENYPNDRDPLLELSRALQERLTKKGSGCQCFFCVPDASTSSSAAEILLPAGSPSLFDPGPSISQRHSREGSPSAPYISSSDSSIDSNLAYGKANVVAWEPDDQEDSQQAGKGKYVIKDMRDDANDKYYKNLESKVHKWNDGG